MLHITQAEYLDAYKIWLQFNDGEQGIVDLGDHLDGPMFTPLKDLELFAKLTFDPTISTIRWPNGADLAPEFLKSLLV
ncbi:MAG: DUF2442 domain-containing protein [Candidatus Caenarcaniphilales bacterium]|jgi:hypothetical protein|nr:DUF2442 domain-containing protein [Candidatus Caenarcaniphilales bacterium]